ncbi:MAG: hypothetical protein ACLPVO_09445 [Desulfomonilaceae bacterium]
MSETLTKLGDNPVFKELVEMLRKQTPQQHDRLKEYMESEHGDMPEADQDPTGQESKNGNNAGWRVV